jgi:hypothetical protein
MCVRLSCCVCVCVTESIATFESADRIYETWFKSCATGHHPKAAQSLLCQTNQLLRNTRGKTQSEFYKVKAVPALLYWDEL